MALKQLMAAVIRPWRHAGPHPPASADRVRLIPRPRIPAMPWVINKSNQTHESSFVPGNNPPGIDWPGLRSDSNGAAPEFDLGGRKNLTSHDCAADVADGSIASF